MELKFKIKIDGNYFSPIEAYQKEYLKLSHEGILTTSGVEIVQFSGLYDKNGEEIYFDDKLTDMSGDIFSLKNVNGTTYLFCLKNGKYQLFSTISSLQCKNKIDYYKIIN